MRHAVIRAGFVALAISLCGGVAEARTNGRGPNIVLILADDLGFSDLGAYGSEIATPNLNALAANGVRFANFHVAGTCSPTRAMLQTGVRSHRAGVGNMPETIPPEHSGRPGYLATLNDRVMTIAQRLETAGYFNILSGKWHLGTKRADQPLARGYHRAFALLQSGADNFENKPNYLIYDEALWVEGDRPAHLPKRFYSSTLIVDKTIAYLEDPARAGRPFLASINFLASHIPVQAPDADLSRYKKSYMAGWDALRTARQHRVADLNLLQPNSLMIRMSTTTDWAALAPDEQRQRAEAMAAHAAMTTAMDREIGRLVAHLKERGEYENTIFLFLSDNGPEPSDPMHMGTFARWNVEQHYDQRIEQQGRPGSLTAIGAGFASAAASPLNGYKFTASEGGLRVPLIIAWPGNPAVRSGDIANGFAHVTDIAPTLLALAGATKAAQIGAPEPITGKDLSPMLTGSTAAVRGAGEGLGYELAGNAAFFKGDYKLVKNLPPYGDGKWRLYNMVTDPGEVQDVSKRQPARFAEMQADYATYARGDGVLEMPAGYSAPKQIMHNAMAELFLPRLLKLWPYVLGLVLGLIGLVVLMRWRKAAG